jgi:hypothetical protein
VTQRSRCALILLLGALVLLWALYNAPGRRVDIVREVASWAWKTRRLWWGWWREPARRRRDHPKR